ncbi:DUF2306 domain-containing protein [Knoellia sp. 3-2P3]|uniref:DUF2306 domain-containing protein n=1 Tax=unclassified Knoellia TaxID=2618719 RepID=UPI0023DB71C8|nr:DUF2306 domain-containing protein [Knoellia sp. 3-2P3]MDF2092222.1 DUF2306 domain-containing protein [Knoellia sp. 3-2P3]
MTSQQWGWRVPAALVALSVIPVLAGTARLVELAGGPAVIPADARFAASPLPVGVHIVCAAVYALLGALQFAAGFRRRRPGWHRAAGRVLVVAALGVAAIRRGDVATHRAWMMRAYAIALAAGTQALTEGVGGAVFGDSALVLDTSRGAACFDGGARRQRAATVLVGDRP